ncbi:uncharacterized protein LOC141619512 [Silene latifolia]|uniref:uncharacterized protein LOC141619512 n=1 Tax=Silene latifolia TaxID=37657 RepID=UPI003D76FC89
MAPPKNLPLLLLLLLTILTQTRSETGIQTQTQTQTVYEVLNKYGLPSGLLPDCVESYTLSEPTGEFQVNLLDTCYINFDYTVYYEKRVTGQLKYGSITHLKGIQVKKLFLWLDVDEIRVDLPPSNSIYFQVGIINKKLGVDQFLNVRSCDKNRLTFGSGSSLRSWNFNFELPPGVNDDIPMLLTE